MLTEAARASMTTVVVIPVFWESGQSNPPQAPYTVLHEIMKIVFRYTLLQIPGWLFLGCLLWWAVSRDWIEFSTAGWIMAAWVLKDALLYPLCKSAYEDGPRIGPETMIGHEAVTSMPLAPVGVININGENWSARSQGHEHIDAGRRIRVAAVDGLVLLVEPLD